MGKVSYDSVMLNNCSKSLNSALQSFDSAISAANGLDVPNFDYQGWLNNLSGQLENCKVQCKEDMEWADNSRGFVNDDLDTAQKDISSVEVKNGFVKEYNIN